MRFVILRKKRVIAVFLMVLIALATCGGVALATTFASPKSYATVVIDAGHGGIDSGVVGKGGLKESKFNLTMSKELGSYLSDSGFRVIYTRKDDNGLYGDATDEFKKKDMAARKKTIQKYNPDFVISVHANKFPGDDRRGAQVFYDSMSADGKSLAEKVQANFNAINSECVGREYEALSGDYYMLKCTLKPSIIVECGFLSNIEDEKLLSDKDYRARLCKAICDGIGSFLDER